MEWDEECIWGPVPKWSRDPDLAAIKKLVCSSLDVSACSVEFMSQGGFNKIYSVSCTKGDFIMRVALPVEPRWKTLGEVSTLNLVGERTDIPVPKVFAFDACDENILGFEWILMERLPGVTLDSAWKGMSLEQKVKLTKRIAHFSAQLFRLRFKHIGSLHAPSEEHPTVGRLVSRTFMRPQPLSEDVFRGPYTSSHQWLSSLVAAQKEQIEYGRIDPDTGEDYEEVKMQQAVTAKILDVLPVLVPEESAFETSFFHGDLSENNILVSDEREITAVIDWEFAAALPLWKVCSLPHLLTGTNRFDCPEREIYVHEEDGSVDSCFFDHLEEYEKTVLVDVFLNEMKRIEPEWMNIRRDNVVRRDLSEVTDECSGEMGLGSMYDWLEECMQVSDLAKMPSLAKMREDSLIERLARKKQLRLEEKGVSAQLSSAEMRGIRTHVKMVDPGGRNH